LSQGTSTPSTPDPNLGRRSNTSSSRHRNFGKYFISVNKTQKLLYSSAVGSYVTSVPAAAAMLGFPGGDAPAAERFLFGTAARACRITRVRKFASPNSWFLRRRVLTSASSNGGSAETAIHGGRAAGLVRGRNQHKVEIVTRGPQRHVRLGSEAQLRGQNIDTPMGGRKIAREFLEARKSIVTAPAQAE
jgi:hypothetical protein